MRIGVPKEIKNHEYRVGLTPASVHELVAYETVPYAAVVRHLGHHYRPADKALAA